MIYRYIVLLIICVSCERRSENEATIRVEDRIFDNANLITVEQEDSLFQSIDELDREIGSDIAIVTLDTLHGESIEEFSLRTAARLQIGRKDINDGILITVVTKNHSMRIEVGYGLEKIVKDEIAARIIREDIVPEFRNGNYYNGLKIGVKRIKLLIEQNKELVGQHP